MVGLSGMMIEPFFSRRMNEIGSSAGAEQKSGKSLFASTIMVCFFVESFFACDLDM